MKTFSEKIAALCERRRFGMKPGLERMEALMGFMGHPERELAAVHVAGTNGKGSVTAIVASVLQEAGLGPVGRYTSPHLVYFNERICINGEPVADAVLDKALDAVEAAVRRVESETDAGTPTFFECATALAFETFREQGVRLAAIETGLGGRLDATNVILPLVSAITCIGLEHCEYLGDTLGKIAAEKAGILKPGRPAVLGASMHPEARAVIEEVAARVGAPIVDPGVIVTPGRARKSGAATVSFEDNIRTVSAIPFPLGGAYQLENLATAVAALEALASVSGLPLPDDAFARGIAKVTWPCRFQTVRETPPVIVDGAHNPNAATALRDSLRKLRPARPLALVAGFCDDKDCVAALKILRPAFARAFATVTPSPRTLSADALAAKLREAGWRDLAAVPAWRDAIAAALDWATRENGGVVICGSLFLAGAACDHFGALPWKSGTVTPSEMLKQGGADNR